MGKKDDFVRLSRENAKVNATFPENNQKCLTKMRGGVGIIIVYFIRSSKFERRREL